MPVDIWRPAPRVPGNTSESPAPLVGGDQEDVRAHGFSCVDLAVAAGEDVTGISETAASAPGTLRQDDEVGGWASSARPFVLTHEPACFKWRARTPALQAFPSW